MNVPWRFSLSRGLENARSVRSSNSTAYASGGSSLRHSVFGFSSGSIFGSGCWRAMAPPSYCRKLVARPGTGGWLLRALELADSREHGVDDTVAARRVELEAARRHLANLRRDGAADHRPRAMQPRLHRLGADPEAFAGLARAQPLDVAQHEHGAIGLGQRVDRGFEHARQLLRVGLALRIRRRRFER